MRVAVELEIGQRSTQKLIKGHLVGLARKYWKARFSRWTEPPSAQLGYTLALPVPGELPVFTDLALSVCADQSSEYRQEIIVIPDSHAGAIAAVVAGHHARPTGALRVVSIPRLESYALRFRPNPFITYGLQFITAARASRASHVIMHDADAFILDRAMLDGLYSECVARDLSCLGVNQVWDDWFTRRELTIAATWEMTFDARWARRFPPYMHMAREWVVDGVERSFDISLYPQLQTPQGKIGLSQQDFDYCHFNHVIGTFRKFQRADSSFTDADYRLLLVRLLSDARGFDTAAVPSIRSMVDGLTDSSQAVRFDTGAEAAPRYLAFREKADRMLEHPVFTGRGRDHVRTALLPFDRHYAV